MPRKTPVPDAEIAIGRRVKQFREEKLITRTAFAASLLISRAQLINYEDGLAPMPWTVGHRLSQKFQVNPRWLATGKLPQLLRTKLPDADRKRFGFREPFSKVYDQQWKNCVETETMNAVTFGFNPKTKPDALESEILELAISGWLQRVPRGRFREFYLDLSADAERILQKMNPADTGPEDL